MDSKYIFRVQQSIDGDWVIVYRRNWLLSFFIHTVKVVEEGSRKIAAARFEEEMDAKLFLKDILTKFKTLDNYHAWVMEEYKHYH